MAQILSSIGGFFVSAWNVVVSLLAGFSVFDILDIAIVAYLIYKCIELFRETRAKQLIKGIILVLVVWGLAQWWGMNSVNWLIQQVADSVLVAVVIIFHPEIRRALEGMGRSNIGRGIFNISTPEEERQNILAGIDAVCRASSSLQENKTGALIVFERETGLGEIINTGTVLSAEASPSLIGNIFFPNTPLHDGAVIIRGGRIHAAGCILPLYSGHQTDKSLGTRHRAAMGMSENSDAVVVVVSEETGVISIAKDGKLTRNYTPITLREELNLLLLKPEEENKKGLLSRIRKSRGGAKK